MIGKVAILNNETKMGYVDYKGRCHPCIGEFKFNKTDVEILCRLHEGALVKYEILDRARGTTLEKGLDIFIFDAKIKEIIEE